MAALIELLVKIQLIDQRQHEAVLSRARSTAGGHVVLQVAEMGYATEGTVARAISVELGLPRIDLAMTPPEGAAIVLLDSRTCIERFLLPVALRENGELLWLAMADPTDKDAIELVRRRTQKRVRPAVAGPTEILRAARALYGAAAAGSSAAGPGEAAAIELGPSDEGAHFEVVKVGADIERSPLPRNANQLGVEVPAAVASRALQKGSARQKPVAEPTDPGPPPVALDQLLAPATRPGSIDKDDLSDDDLATVEALRVSLEKGAHILRSLAELCVEKNLFTREEMKRRNSRG